MNPGALLRLARQAAGLSQLELSIVLGVSQRHVSFVERGRARASRSLIVDWMSATQAPRELLSAALWRAGFAMDPGMTRGRPPAAPDEAARLLLAASSSLPIVVFDDAWVIGGMNAAGQWLARHLMPGLWDQLHDQGVGSCMLDNALEDAGLLGRMRNAKAAASSLLSQVRRESWTNDALLPALDRLQHSFSRRFGVRLGAPQDEHGTGARLFAFDTSFGLLQFRTVQGRCGEWRTEHWLPVDSATERVMHNAASRPGAGMPAPSVA